MNPARAPAPSPRSKLDRVFAIGCGVALVLATLFAYRGTFAVPFVLDVGALACWLPARRATRVNPVEALRSE